MTSNRKVTGRRAGSKAPATDQDTPGSAPAKGNWTHQLNRLLIALGVIAFGVIVTDRVLEAFRADDAPAEVALLDDVSSLSAEPVNETATATAQTVAPVPAVDDRLQSTAQRRVDESNFAELADMELIARLQELFGSRVILVSATEPVYVLTEDMRRIEIGGSVNESNESITLAGVSADLLTLKHNGELMPVRLPDRSAE